MHINSGSMELYGIVCENSSECLIKGENVDKYGILNYLILLKLFYLF
jgi:hypothetical protein